MLIILFLHKILFLGEYAQKQLLENNNSYLKNVLCSFAGKLTPFEIYAKEDSSQKTCKLKSK